MTRVSGFITMALLGVLLSTNAGAQVAACTSLTVGQTQDITAFSVCRKVTLNSVPAPAAGVAGICVPTNTSAAEWASFYNNPPPGVSIASCSVSCGGYTYSLNNGCYYMSTSGANDSCDTVCASRGGCDSVRTKDIGSDDPGATRCSAVVTGITGVSVTASGVNTAGQYQGCIASTLKGGWLAVNYYGGSPTNCSAATTVGRVCACNN